MTDNEADNKDKAPPPPEDHPSTESSEQASEEAVNSEETNHSEQNEENEHLKDHDYSEEDHDHSEYGDDHFHDEDHEYGDDHFHDEDHNFDHDPHHLDSSEEEYSTYNDSYEHPNYWEDDSHEFEGDQQKMSLGDHLEELRRCLFKCMAILVVFSIASAFFYEDIFNFIMDPINSVLEDGERPQTRITEAFTVILKCVVMFALCFSLPLIIREFWKFAKPGLKIKEQNFIFYLMSLGTILFIGGMAMAYYLVVPLTIDFFIQLHKKLDIGNIFFVGDTLSYVTNMMIVFGIAFETPIVVMGLLRSGIVELKTLQSIRKYVVFAAVIIGGVFTPPDIISQVLLGGTLYFLYEIGLLLGKVGFIPKSKKKESEKNSK